MSNEKKLSFVLRLTAVACVPAIVAVFMPRAWMDWPHRLMGLGPLPEGPVFEYLARSISALYFAHGMAFWVLAGDVRRYLPLVRFVAVAYLLFGAVMFWIDHHAGVPLPWRLVEGPSILLMGMAVLVMYRRVRNEVTSESGAEACSGSKR